MRRFVWYWLAISSLVVAMVPKAPAETRPQYGGALRVSMRARLTSLNPADATQEDSPARRGLTRLIFETLVMIDQDGQVQPLLAESWQTANGQRRWQFHLRQGVRFHDGTVLTAEGAAASLRMANPGWNVTADSDSVTIQCENSAPELLAELALPRNAIVRKTSDNNFEGTGPFYVADWQPGRNLTLSAEENYRGGRAFLDGIEVAMGQNYRDQMMQLDLGRADLIEVAPEQARRVSSKMQLATSAPIELLALVFAGEPQTPDEKSLREALALSIERGSIRSVLLQGAGQPTASLLPNWMSGYGFVFSPEADLAQAHRAREQVRAAEMWSLAYDSNDPLARLLAERIALNARDAGLTLRLVSTGGDLRLLRIPLASPNPRAALTMLAQTLKLHPLSSKENSTEELYRSEQSVLSTHLVIPLFHMPVCYASSPALKNLTLQPDGSWDLSDAWLGSGAP